MEAEEDLFSLYASQSYILVMILERDIDFVENVKIHDFLFSNFSFSLLYLIENHNQYFLIIHFSINFYLNGQEIKNLKLMQRNLLQILFTIYRNLHLKD